MSAGRVLLSVCVGTWWVWFGGIPSKWGRHVPSHSTRDGWHDETSKWPHDDWNYVVVPKSGEVYRMSHSPTPLGQ